MAKMPGIFGVCVFLIFLFIIILFGRDLLLLFGAGYDKAYPVLLIQTVGALINFTVAGYSGQALVYMGHVKRYIVYTYIMIAVLIFVGSILTYYYGMVGTALATVGAHFIYSWSVRIYLQSHTQLKPLGFV